jgi:predicted transcriptional regulator
MELYELLKALSSQRRLEILNLLEESEEELRLSTIASKLNIPPPTVKDHLDKLLISQLVQGEKFYSIKPIWKTIKLFLKPLIIIAKSFNFLSDYELHDLPIQFVLKLHELEPTQIVEAPLFLGEIVKNFQDQQQKELMFNAKVMGSFDLNLDASIGTIIASTVDTSAYQFDFKFIISLKSLETVKITPWQFISQYDNIVSLNDFRYLQTFPIHIILFPSANLGCVFLNKSGQADFRLGWKITNEQGIKWMSEIFDYYWDKALPLPKNNPNL